MGDHLKWANSIPVEGITEHTNEHFNAIHFELWKMEWLFDEIMWTKKYVSKF